MAHRWQRVARFVPSYYVASAAAFLVTAQLAQVWIIDPGGYQLFFPAAGAAVGVALASPRRHGLAVAAIGAALGSLVSAGIDGLPIDDASLYAIAYAVETAIAFWLGLLLARRTIRGNAMATIIWLAMCGFAAAAGALVAVVGLDPAAKLEFVVAWLLADGMGIYLVGPAPFVFRSLSTLSSGRFATVEIRVSVLVLALATVVTFASTTSVAYLVLPPLTWVCLRGGIRYGFPSAIAISVYACTLTAAGHGPFAHGDPRWFTPLTGFILAIGVSASAMNLFAERAELRRIQIRAIVRAMPDAVVVVDGDGLVVASNTVGQPDHDTGDEGNNVASNEIRAVDLDVETNASTGRIIESRRVEVGDGTRLSVVRDITDLIEMTRLLDASADRWSRIIQAAREGIAEIDADSKITYASERFCQIVGCAAASLIGTEFLVLLAESSRAAVVQASALARAGSSVPIEAEIAISGGDTRWVLISASPQLDDDGNFLCSTIFLTDITNIKTAEFERIEMADQLADVEMSEKARLARDLHDGPLQDLTAVQLILAHLATKDGADFELVNKASDAMLDALIALRSGVHALEPVDVMNGSLAEALQRHAIRAKGASDVAIEVGQVGSPPLGSQAQVLYRIGREAITNATRHAAASSIRISIAESDDRYVLRVADDGRGFAGDPTLQTAHIGLRSIRERAQRANGSLTIVSAAGQGTIIEVTLPAELEAASD